MYSPLPASSRVVLENSNSFLSTILDDPWARARTVEKGIPGLDRFSGPVKGPIARIQHDRAWLRVYI